MNPNKLKQISNTLDDLIKNYNRTEIISSDIVTSIKDPYYYKEYNCLLNNAIYKGSTNKIILLVMLGAMIHRKLYIWTMKHNVHIFEVLLKYQKPDDTFFIWQKALDLKSYDLIKIIKKYDHINLYKFIKLSDSVIYIRTKNKLYEPLLLYILEYTQNLSQLYITFKINELDYLPKERFMYYFNKLFYFIVKLKEFDHNKCLYFILDHIDIIRNIDMYINYLKNNFQFNHIDNFINAFSPLNQINIILRHFKCSNKIFCKFNLACENILQIFDIFIDNGHNILFHEDGIGILTHFGIYNELFIYNSYHFIFNYYEKHLQKFILYNLNIINSSIFRNLCFDIKKLILSYLNHFKLNTIEYQLYLKILDTINY